MPPKSKESHEKLRSLRKELLSLHSALLQAEKIAYEKKHGRIRSSGEYFKLVTEDSWFEWLRPLSEIVVQIDMMVDGKEPSTEKHLQILWKQTKVLIKSSKSGSAFSKKLSGFLQSSPDVILAFASVSRLLNPETVH